MPVVPQANAGLRDRFSICSGADARPDRGDAHDSYTGLREQLLATKPAELGLAPSARLPRVWAALMELGMDREPPP